MNAKTKYNLSTEPQCVLAYGPDETDGDGGYEYCVCFGDDDGDPITDNKECVWYMWKLESAVKFARELSRKYNLELVNEAVTA